MSNPDTTAEVTNPSAVDAATNDPNSSRQSDGELLQLVTFAIGTEEFAISILQVREINRMMKITPVPQSPKFIEGVINLRGNIIPVMNMRKRFSMESLENTSDARIIVVEVASRVIGFTVDRVSEVLRISADIVEPAPPMVCGIDSDYVQGVGKLNDRLLILLNLERLFEDEDLEKIDQTTEAAAAAAA